MKSLSRGDKDLTHHQKKHVFSSENTRPTGSPYGEKAG
jgi:hypothetical protein